MTNVTAMSLLEIKNLRRAFYGLDVLRGVDLPWRRAASPG